jgi:septal ring factor EnvC (AmiA/AmiB activator)
MTFGLGLLVGLLIGWLAEWALDWLVWRRSLHGWRERLQQAQADRARLQDRLAEADQQRESLEAELAALRARHGPADG